MKPHIFLKEYKTQVAMWRVRIYKRRHAMNFGERQALTVAKQYCADRNKKEGRL